MTTLTPAIALPDMPFLSERRATRYPEGMPKKHVDDPLYTTPRFTTTQVAAMLGIKRPTVHSAIQRGTLPSELASVGVRLVSQAAIDAYRVNHLGQVGQPSRKKRRMTQKAAALQAVTTTTLPSNVSTGATDGPNADDGKEA